MADMDKHVSVFLPWAIAIKLTATTTRKLGDLSSFIVDREIELLDTLQSKLLECRPQLLKAHRIIMELDW